MPMGYSGNWISINHLSNFSLQRLADNKLTRHERSSIDKKTYDLLPLIKTQAKEILIKRGY